MKPATRDIRRAARMLPDVDQADYLLEVIDDLMPDVPEAHDVDQLGLRLTPQERYVLTVLADGDHVPTSRSRLRRVLHADGGSVHSDDKIVDVLICRIRKKLTGTPLSIRNVRNSGWVLDGWPMERATTTDLGGHRLAAR